MTPITRPLTPAEQAFLHATLAQIRQPNRAQPAPSHRVIAGAVLTGFGLGLALCLAHALLVAP